MATPQESKVTTLDDSPEVPAQSRATKSTAKATELKGSGHDAELSGGKVTITIFSSDLEGGHEAVPVFVNGYGYQIPRDTPSDVPIEVAEIIKQAKTTTYKSATGGGVTEHVVNRFAYQIEKIAEVEA